MRRFAMATANHVAVAISASLANRRLMRKYPQNYAQCVGRISDSVIRQLGAIR
jgi:hypothetical protein